LRGGAEPAETVLVHGASGGVGTAAVQLARAHGLRVFGSAGTRAGCELVRQQGAHEVFDHQSKEYLAGILHATAGRGVDLIIEMLANVNLGNDLGLLAKSGRVVVVGNRGKIEIDPREAMGRDADIRGMTLFNAAPPELALIHAALAAGLENGALKPVIGREFPLAAASSAHDAVMSSGAHGKIILLPE
jgi:NADPH2:quinone reductase